MSIVCYINVYNSHVDRGATVTSTPIKHYEVDENEIQVGEPLPKLDFTNKVTAYDGQHITIAFYNKTCDIKVGDEVEVACTEHHVGGGVYSRNCYYVRLLDTKVVYKGDWQKGSTVRQLLEGPIGEGEVFYPNGDHFKGTFHLSYASIWGPAYAAEGCYTFADGSYIEHAWIHTSKDKKPEWWGLHGVYRIKHQSRSEKFQSADAPDSIAMFLHGGRRYGFELVLTNEFSEWNKPWVKEWYAGDSVVRYEGPNHIFQYKVEDYKIDEEKAEQGFTTLRLTLKDGNNIYKVEQRGGDNELNKYDNLIYKPSTRVTLWLPNGDRLEHYGDDVKDFKPYDGFAEVHCANTKQYRMEQWEKGKLVDDREWKPEHQEAEVKPAKEPHGPAVKLHVEIGHRSYTAYSEGKWKYEEFDTEVQEDQALGIEGFWNYEVTKVCKDSVTITFCDEEYVLTHDKPLHLYKDIEGREWSDGCVYDGDEYSAELTWLATGDTKKKK